MNGLPPYEYYHSCLKTAFELANRSLDAEGFNYHVRMLVETVARGEESTSKSLKNEEKVNNLIRDFKEFYFSQEQGDIFSHKLMQRVIKHEPVNGKTFQETKKAAEKLALQFKNVDSLIARPDNWLTHFFITLIGKAEFDREKELCKSMPEETMNDFLDHFLELISEVSVTHLQDFLSQTSLSRLIHDLREHSLEKPSFLEASDSVDYLRYRFEGLIFDYQEYKNEVLDLLVTKLNAFREIKIS